jgi:hypothetical protein
MVVCAAALRSRGFQYGDATTRLRKPSTWSRDVRFASSHQRRPNQTVVEPAAPSSPLTRFRPLALCRRRLSMRVAWSSWAGVRKPSQNLTLGFL